jgi:predicted peptidase
MMHKLRKFLRFAFLCTVVISGRTHTFGAVGRITIEKEGKPPTANELALARRAYSVELAVVRVDASTEYTGFKANPIVNAAAAVASYCEGDAPPYLFRIFLPKTANPKKKCPLILWLHGHGESLSDNESQMAHMQTSIDVLAGPDRPDFFLVALQCPVETHSWESPDPRAPNGETPLEMLDKIVRVLIEEYPIDVDRISLLGICTGGMVGFDLIKKFPGRFSAFAACSSDVPHDTPKNYCRLPIWLFNNCDDMTAWSENLRFAKAVNKVRGDMYVTLHEKGGHNTWTGAQREGRIIEWLLRQRRGRFAFPRDVPVLDNPKERGLLMFALPMAVLTALVVIAQKTGERG